MTWVLWGSIAILSVFLIVSLVVAAHKRERVLDAGTNALIAVIAILVGVAMSVQVGQEPAAGQVLLKGSLDGQEFVDASFRSAALVVGRGAKVMLSIGLQNVGGSNLRDVRVQLLRPNGFDYIEGSQTLRYALPGGSVETVPIPSSEEPWIFSEAGRSGWGPGFAAEYLPGTGVVFRVELQAKGPPGMYRAWAIVSSQGVEEDRDDVWMRVR